MVKFAGLQNAKEASVALLEFFDPSGPLDERFHHHSDYEASQSQRPPFRRNNPGALQLKEMPWDLEKKRNNSFLLGSSLLALAILF